MMRSLAAILRISLALVVLTIGFIAILAVSWLPVTIRRAPLVSWTATLVARAILRLFGVQMAWQNPGVFARHEGFIFPNHISYVDVLVMSAFAPVRYLAKAEIAAWPMIGYIARRIGCVFVKRENRESRSAAREALGKVKRFPPIVLFPEGGTGPPGQLRPFRYGAFEIVIGGVVPFLPCIIDYGDNANAVYWGDENFLQSMYKFLKLSRRPVIARVVPLRPVVPLEDDDPRLMAIAMHGAMEALRQSLLDDQKLVQPGL